MKVFRHEDRPTAPAEEESIEEQSVETVASEATKKLIRLVATHAVVKIVVDTSFSALRRLTSKNS